MISDYAKVKQNWMVYDQESSNLMGPLMDPWNYLMDVQIVGSTLDDLGRCAGEGSAHPCQALVQAQEDAGSVSRPVK